MQLQNKTAVVYGAGGAVGAAVATAFAREGAKSVRLDEVSNAAVFAASDKASSMTGTVINLTGGIIVD